MTDHAFAGAAAILGCTVEAVLAVWQVECAGQPFRSDRSLTRRFEPHHMPRSGLSWRDSLALSYSRRDAEFDRAYQRNPDAALRATSWGGPQIMGFNHRVCGYDTAADMVEAMAASEDNQLAAFVTFVQYHGLDGALRSCDWTEFARGYNGSGQIEEYGRRIGDAYEAMVGRRARPVVRTGHTGRAVVLAQTALHAAGEDIFVDGIFGPETARAVRSYQRRHGLEEDGVVGARTWARLELEGVGMAAQ